VLAPDVEFGAGGYSAGMEVEVSWEASSAEIKEQAAPCSVSSRSQAS